MFTRHIFIAFRQLIELISVTISFLFCFNPCVMASRIAYASAVNMDKLSGSLVDIWNPSLYMPIPTFSLFTDPSV